MAGEAAAAAAAQEFVDGAALAKLYGEPLFEMPEGLFIPPDALEVFLESFEGPLDLLLYLIRRQKFDVLDIPMALLTEQYMEYVEIIRSRNLELAADYLVMAAELMRIKSRLLLPAPRSEEGGEAEDPKAELARRLLEYERMKLAARRLDELPRAGRDFWRSAVPPLGNRVDAWPEVAASDLLDAFRGLLEQQGLKSSHRITREELSVREFMTRMLQKLSGARFAEFRELIERDATGAEVVVSFIALLELAREGSVRITQPVPFAPLWVSRAG